MMRNKHGETPKEVALSIVLTEIAAFARELPYNHRDTYTPSFEFAVREQLAKLHNRMLDKSKLDGIHIYAMPPRGK